MGVFNFYVCLFQLQLCLCLYAFQFSRSLFGYNLSKRKKFCYHTYWLYVVGFAYTNPALALSSFEPNSYGLLLLDINMPTMNGFELFKKMKSIDSKAEVCFITAFEDYREEFRESFPMLDEAKYFIRKPKAIEDLVNHVATILG
jgi:response regulator RpfG family c-di-GMP phosphodiesterase